MNAAIKNGKVLEINKKINTSQTNIRLGGYWNMEDIMVEKMLNLNGLEFFDGVVTKGSTEPKLER